MDKFEVLTREDGSLSADARKVAQLAAKEGRQTATWLSPEKDAAPFNLFLQGYDHEEISAILNLPLEMVVMTALRYRWDKRKRQLGIKDGHDAAEQMLNILIDSQLSVSVMAIQEELREIAAGKIKPSQSKYAAKDVKSVQLLMQSAAALHKIQLGFVPIGGSQSQVNVQVNNAAPQAPQQTPLPAAITPLALEGARNQAFLERLAALDQTVTIQAEPIVTIPEQSKTVESA